MQEKSVGFSVIRDQEFSKANKALDAKTKYLKKQGKGNKPNAAQPLTAEMSEEMWVNKFLGKHNGEALTNVNFLNISQQFSFRGRQEHNQLKYGDFNIVITSTGKYMEWSVERLRKIAANKQKFNQKMWASGHEERCPVMMFLEYVAHRPSTMCLADSPFWLAINYNLPNGKFLKKPAHGSEEDQRFDEGDGSKYRSQMQTGKSTQTTPTGRR